MTRRRQRQLTLGVVPRVSDRSRHGPYRTYASESDVQKAVLELCRRHPRVAWAHRMNTGMTRAEYTSKTTGVTSERVIRFAFRGCADILGQMRDGRFLAIEVKKWDGRATPEQLAFLERIAHFGGVAGIARCVEDAQAIIEEQPPEGEAA